MLQRLLIAEAGRGVGKGLGFSRGLAPGCQLLVTRPQGVLEPAMAEQVAGQPRPLGAKLILGEPFVAVPLDVLAHGLFHFIGQAFPGCLVIVLRRPGLDLEQKAQSGPQ